GGAADAEEAAAGAAGVAGAAGANDVAGAAEAAGVSGAARRTPDERSPVWRRLDAAGWTLAASGDVSASFMVLLYHISARLQPFQPSARVIFRRINKPDGSASDT